MDYLLSQSLKTHLQFLCVIPIIILVKTSDSIPPFSRDILFNDLHCVSLTFDLGTSRSKLDCTVRCGRVSDCRSFFYNVISKDCYGSYAVTTSTVGCTSVLGTLYYTTTDITTTSTSTTTTTTSTTTTPTTTTAVVTTITTTTSAPTVPYGSVCGSDSDCLPLTNTVCLSGTCQCSPGYRLVPDTQTCTTSCTTYGPTYIRIPGWAFDVDVIGGANGITVAQCKTLCSTYSTCTGLNFCGPCGNMCRCKEGSPLDSPSDWLENSIVDYYTRNCA